MRETGLSCIKQYKRPTYAKDERLAGALDINRKTDRACSKSGGLGRIIYHNLSESKQTIKDCLGLIRGVSRRRGRAADSPRLVSSRLPARRAP